AKVLHRDDKAQRLAGAVKGFKTDQVGVVELIRLGGRERASVDAELKAGQLRRRVPVVDAAEFCHQDILGGAHAVDLEGAAAPGKKLAVATDRQRVGGKTLQAHFALDAMRRADDGEDDSHACRIFKRGARVVSANAAARSAVAAEETGAPAA